MSFTFVDLCCGIGGFHIACARNGGKCIQACDIDIGARGIYELNHHLKPETDVSKIVPPRRHIDLVCFGNPCQSFSSVGLRRGLKDTRGKVFFAIVEYLKQSKAKCFIMENVKGLLSIHKGKDFHRMLHLLNALGYKTSYKVLNALDFGVGQSRERVFVVGSLEKSFDFEKIASRYVTRPSHIHRFLNKGRPHPSLLSHRFDGFDLSKPPVMTKTGFQIKAEIAPYTEKRLFSSDGVIGTIMSSMSPFIYDERYKLVRHLDVKELLRLQSFPSDFKFPNDTSRNKALKYIGNAVCVNVVDALLREMRAQKMM